MAIEYNFTLDMDRSKRDNNIAYARTGDVDSITINADLVLNGAAYTPTGTNAFFECITPNGHSVRAAAEKTGSTVSVEVPSAAFQAAGVINVAYFRFESGEADNPTYVESTEPFAIVVREGVGDNVDAGDYIEEWRQLADQLEAIVAEVEQKAEQAKAAIDEQKTEVDTLKSQAQQQIAQDVIDVESAATAAKSSISTQVDGVGTAAEAAKSEINDKVAGIQSQVDTVISDAKQEVDENIAELDKATQDAVDAMNEALSGEQVQQLKDAISRHWALDAQDMGAISSGNDLDTFTTVKSYVCKTDAIAKSLVNKPEDLACSFIMHVMSIDSSSNYLVQLIIPQTYDDTKSSVSFYIRKRVSAGTFTGWKKVGADVVAGTGIKIEDDVVSIDPDSFHQSYEDISLASSDTSITGGASIEELAVKGNTRQNLWVNPSGTKNGVTLSANEDGTLKLSGTPTQSTYIDVKSYVLAAGKTYTLSIGNNVSDSGNGFYVAAVNSSGSTSNYYVGNGTLSKTFTVPSDTVYCYMGFGVNDSGVTINPGTYRVMLNEGSEAEPWCPPGINGVDELSIVTAGKNLYDGNDVSSSNYAQISVHRWLSSLFVGKKVRVSFDLLTENGGTWYIYAYQSSGLSITFGPSAIDFGYRIPFKTESGVSAHFSATGTVFYNPVDGMSPGQIMIYKDSSERGSVSVSNIQIEFGDDETGYESPSITQTAIDMQGHALHSLPDGTRDELRIDGTGAVTLVQRVRAVTVAGSALDTDYTPNKVGCTLSGAVLDPPQPGDPKWQTNGIAMGDVLPPVDVAYGVSALGFSGASSVAPYRLYVNAPCASATDYDGARAWLNSNPLTVLYKLATTQEIDLGRVELPSVKSDKMNVWIISNKVSEEVKFDISLNKVDYREIDAPSADDVYTKQEVDSILEAKEDAFEVLPVSSGGTGVTTAAAERNRLGLGNTTGALPIANGGTGATTADNAFRNIHSLGIVTTVETSDFVSLADKSGWRGKVASLATFWNTWLVKQIRFVFGFSSSNVLPVSNGGTGATEPGVTMLSNLGITFGTADPPSTGTPGSIYIQYFE